MKKSTSFEYRFHYFSLSFAYGLGDRTIKTNWDRRVSFLFFPLKICYLFYLLVISSILFGFFETAAAQWEAGNCGSVVTSVRGVVPRLAHRHLLLVQ
jgi:hypothetical protein